MVRDIMCFGFQLMIFRAYVWLSALIDSLQGLELYGVVEMKHFECMCDRRPTCCAVSLAPNPFYFVEVILEKFFDFLFFLSYHIMVHRTALGLVLRTCFCWCSGILVVL